ncbi:MAG TPA: AraC family transcriptional regulator [Acetobacteraceae bacterium]|nr:AraC family transcriptional regulator [Acetobacteraceae bacterium]
MNGVDRGAATERAVFWRHPHFRDMGLLKARFRRYRYALHTHATYVIALITGGCESVRVGRRRETAPVNSVIIVNPEECHDGEAGCDDGWAYRTFYPPVELMAEVSRELGQAALPLFPRTLLDDPALAEDLAAAHRTAEAGDTLAAEAAMLDALRRLILCHGDVGRPGRAHTHVGSRRRMAVYREMIEADAAGRFALADFAVTAEVSRFQVIRDFRQVTGFTPSAFVRDRRVRAAGRLIQEGETLADAAVGAGFADQSHLTRAFKLSHGFTPGVLRKAFAY